MWVSGIHTNNNCIVPIKYVHFGVHKIVNFDTGSANTSMNADTFGSHVMWLAAHVPIVKKQQMNNVINKSAASLLDRVLAYRLHDNLLIHPINSTQRNHIHYIPMTLSGIKVICNNNDSFTISEIPVCIIIS